MTAVLEDFLTSLAKRLADAADTQAAPPILAISEGIDSFLADDIAQHNEVFSKAWPADREMDEQRLVDAFIALVTAAHAFDSKLQKLFDKLVPRKVKSELVFWRRYFAHAHALLSRLAPLPDEMEHALLSRLPPPRRRRVSAWEGWCRRRRIRRRSRQARSRRARSRRRRKRTRLHRSHRRRSRRCRPPLPHRRRTRRRPRSRPAWA